MKKPLSEIKEGAAARVCIIDCGSRLNYRLCSIGVACGEKLEILKNDMHGPIIVKVVGTCIVIGRGQAEKIIVESD